jgi:hypothetical protein
VQPVIVPLMSNFTPVWAVASMHSSPPRVAVEVDADADVLRSVAMPGAVRVMCQPPFSWWPSAQPRPSERHT